MTGAIQKVMVVDDRKPITDMIYNYTMPYKGEFSTIVSNKPEYVMQILAENEDVRIIISDYRMLTIHGKDLFDQVRAKYPTIQFIMMPGPENKELREHVQLLGFVHDLNKPFGLYELVKTIREILPLSLMLADVIQLIGTSTTNGVLEVSTHVDHGKIFFRNGEMVHAESGDFGGVDAFLEMYKWRKIAFCISDLPEDTPRTIFDSWQELLIEAAKIENTEPGEYQFFAKKDPDAGKTESDNDGIDTAKQPDSIGVQQTEQEQEALIQELLTADEDEKTEQHASAKPEVDKNLTSETDSDFMENFDIKDDEDIPVETSSITVDNKEDIPEIDLDEEALDKIDFNIDDSEPVSSRKFNLEEIERELLSHIADSNQGVDTEVNDKVDNEDDTEAVNIDEDIPKPEFEPRLEDLVLLEDAKIGSDDDFKSAASDHTPVEETDLKQPVAEFDKFEEPAQQSVLETENTVSPADEEFASSPETQESGMFVEQPVDTEEHQITSTELDFIEPAAVEEDSSIGLEDLDAEFYVDYYLRFFPQDRDLVSIGELPILKLLPLLRRHQAFLFHWISTSAFRFDETPFNFNSPKVAKAAFNLIEVLLETWKMTSEDFKAMLWESVIFQMARSLNPIGTIAEYLSKHSEGKVVRMKSLLTSMISQGVIEDYFQPVVKQLDEYEKNIIKTRQVENLIVFGLEQQGINRRIDEVYDSINRLLSLAGIGSEIEPEAIQQSVVIMMLTSRNLEDFARYLDENVPSDEAGITPELFINLTNLYNKR